MEGYTQIFLIIRKYKVLLAKLLYSSKKSSIIGRIFQWADVNLKCALFGKEVN